MPNTPVDRIAIRLDLKVFVRCSLFLILILFPALPAVALEPNEILIITNSDIAESGQLADFYCRQRNIPKANIVSLALGSPISDTISRNNYQSKLAVPLRKKLTTKQFAGKIKCLVTTYGVPYKVGKADIAESDRYLLEYLTGVLAKEKQDLQQSNLAGTNTGQINGKNLQGKITWHEMLIASLKGEETNASVDSELSMVFFDNYELYRWQPNKLKGNNEFWDYKTLMVSRLDGPSLDIAEGLIAKALAAEKNGLKGKAYIDSRGIVDDNKMVSFGDYDQSFRDLAQLLKDNTKMPVIEEKTEGLFAPGQCPDTAIYCGWYSLKKYIDSFTFVDGAIGYHLASWEAIDIRDANSTQWCPSLLKKGVTVTLGAVAEPYLHGFPKPDEFFGELLKGDCVAEAFYRTNPFNSWQLLLIADPLYKPFGRR